MCSPPYVLKCLYNSLVLPYLMFCNVIWGDAASIHLNKLLVLQKRAVRIISSSDYLAHTDGLFRELFLMKITDIYKFSSCMYVFTHKNKYETNHNIYGTRNCELVKVMFQRLSRCQRSIYYNPPKIFNALPPTLLALKGRNVFKRSIKNLFINAAA